LVDLFFCNEVIDRTLGVPCDDPLLCKKSLHFYLENSILQIFYVLLSHKESTVYLGSVILARRCLLGAGDGTPGLRQEHKENKPDRNPLGSSVAVSPFFGVGVM
jgi:hypothetical protein